MVVSEVSESGMSEVALPDNDNYRGLSEEEHLKKVLKVIRAVKKLITREKKTGNLIRETCRVLTEDLSYHNAWIVLLDNEGNPLDSAFSGFADTFKSVEEKFLSGEFPPCVQMALEQDEVLVLKNPPVECPDCYLSGAYTDRAGFTSVLSTAGETFGVVSASVPLSFASSYIERELFGELASDISLGLHRLMLENNRISVERDKAQILDSISDAMITLDRNQNITFFNRAAERTLKREHGEVMGRNVLEVFPQGDDPVFTQRYMEAITTGRPVSFEVCFQREPYKNWYELRLYPSVDGSISIYFTVTTDKKLSEIALNESRERLELAIEGAELGTWDWDIGTGRVTFNSRWAEMLGFRLDELEGSADQWEKLIHPDDLEHTLQSLSNHLAGKSASYRTEYRLRHKSGDWVWVLDTGRVITFDSEGNPLRMCGTHMDVTESVLKDSRIKLLGYMLDSAPASITVHDNSGKFLYANKATVRLHGYSNEGDFKSINLHQLDLPESEKLLAERFRKIEEGGESSFEVYHYRKDRSTFPLQVHAKKIDWNGKSAVLSIASDITEQLNAEKALRESEQRFQQFQRLESVGRLAGGVAHDLNNLLTPILGYGEMLASNDKLQPADKEHVDQIVSAGERARDLVGQLLAFSRKQTMKFSKLDVNDLVNDFASLLRRTITEDIEIDFQLSEQPQFVTGDRGQLEQVIMNLAVNARDAMPDGGLLTISTASISVSNGTTTEHQGMDNRDYCRLQVMDTGSGMEKDVCDQIFEPFFTTKGMTEGTGLGLATVYGIVKQHGGYIWVDSEKKKGTIFSIYLPLSDGTGYGAGLEANLQGVEAGNETVLLVEDDPQVRNLTFQILSEAGYRIISASNGREALMALDSTSDVVDLLLTDVVMPGLNGKELYDLLKRKRKNLRVLYMSGYPDDVITSRGIMEKGVNFLHKPFTAGTLTARVRQVLDS